MGNTCEECTKTEENLHDTNSLTKVNKHKPR